MLVFHCRDEQFGGQAIEAIQRAQRVQSRLRPLRLLGQLQQRLNLTVKYSIPTSGTPLLVDAIAVVRGTKKAAMAKRYYEFVTTPEALVFAADSFLRIPARKDIPNEKLPAWIQDANARIIPMTVDRGLIAQHLDEWMTYWDSHIRNSGRRK